MKNNKINLSLYISLRLSIYLNNMQKCVITSTLIYINALTFDTSYKSFFFFSPLDIQRDNGLRGS